MCEKWLVIGISGVTCGGKTTLANALSKILPGSRVISQDDYFLGEDDERHTWIPELDHINFDILTSLDMQKMHEDVVATVGDRLDGGGGKDGPLIPSMEDLQRLAAASVKQKGIAVLIVEGFSIFNYAPIADLLDAKYYFELRYEECRKRRELRVYYPPDCPGYFEQCVWPEYLKQVEQVRTSITGVTYFDEHSNEPIKTVLNDIIKILLY